MARTMDSPKLRKLARGQIQSIAKRELVRAVGKTEDIIRRLVRKHPAGVPVPSDVVGESASPPAKTKNVLKKTRKGGKQQTPLEPTEREDEMVAARMQVKQEAGPSTAPPTDVFITEAAHSDAEHDLRAHHATTDQGAGSSHQAPVNTVLPDATVLGPSTFPSNEPARTTQSHGAHAPDAPSEQAGPSLPAHATNPTTTTSSPATGPSTTPDQNQNSSPTSPELPLKYTSDGYPRTPYGPDEDTVVDVLREFTMLVNTIPVLESRIRDTERLLDRTTAIVQDIMPDLREVCIGREHLELFLMGKMKKKRELWDGTAKMSKNARKVRVAWLRAQRKAENVRKWEAENKSYAERGLSPEPYEHYASESEGEIIESLQTTPASSICGSPKRGREDHIEAEGGQKKRRRS